MNSKNTSFLDIYKTMDKFWKSKGCEIIKPFDDVDIGAGTLHPEGTFFRALKQEESRVAFLQQCNRPEDNSNSNFDDGLRSNIFHQYQVLITPYNSIETDPITLIKDSFECIMNNYEDRYEFEVIKDDWKSPCIGAFGIGYEVRLNGIEVAQVTYIQKMGGIKLDVPSLEITYGLDRVAMLFQEAENIKDVIAGIDRNNEPIFLDCINAEINPIERKDFMSTHSSLLRYFYKESTNNIETYKQDYLVLLDLIHEFNYSSTMQEMDKSGVAYHFRTKLISEFMSASRIIAKAYLDANNIKILGVENNIEVKQIENKNKRLIGFDISKFKYLNKNIITSICKHIFPNCEINEKLMLVFVSCAPDSYATKCIDKLINNAFAKYDYLFNKALYVDIDKCNVGFSPIICNNINKKLDEILYSYGRVSHQTHNHLNSVYIFIEHFSDSKFSKEYGDNSELFKNSLFRAVFKKFDNISSLEIIYPMCKILYHINTLIQDEKHNSQFYRKHIREIAKNIHTSMMMYSNFSKCYMYIIYDAMKQINNSHSARDELFIDDIISDIQDRVCDLISEDYYEDYDASYIINKMSKDIEHCYHTCTKLRLSIIYKIHMLSKRLIPKIASLLDEDRSLDINGETNIRFGTYEHMLYLGEKLAKPFSEYTHSDKDVLLSFACEYKRLFRTYNLKEVISDICRIYKGKDKL